MTKLKLYPFKYFKTEKKVLQKRGFEFSFFLMICFKFPGENEQYEHKNISKP